VDWIGEIYNSRLFELNNGRLHWKREFDDIKWLNMNLKPDKECEKRGDIVFLSKIVMNSMHNKKSNWKRSIEDDTNYRILEAINLFS